MSESYLRRIEREERHLFTDEPATLQRAQLDWPSDSAYPDRFYFLSPDGERWFEVTEECFNEAPRHAEEFAAELSGDVHRVNWTRLALLRLAGERGRAIAFD